MQRITVARAVSFVALSILASSAAQAQTAYGVNANGSLFKFDLASPQNVTTIGNVGFVPEGLDFRPSSQTLYALNVGPNTTQLYTVNLATAAPTAVGAGFNSTGTNYNLVANQTFGFDFNPTTLQVDNSMRIRLVSTSGTNIRLHSATGQIAAVDTSLAFANGNSPFVDGAAYINNIATIGGTTALYDMDSRNNALLLQSPPNAGTVNTVGPFGATIDNTQSGIGFDIYTTPGNTDPTIAGDAAYAVLQRPDAPVGGPLGSYLLYSVNLATGTITNGALVGPAATPADFTGGFAILPIVPEPVTMGAFVAASLAGLRRRR